MRKVKKQSKSEKRSTKESSKITPFPPRQCGKSVSTLNYHIKGLPVNLAENTIPDLLFATGPLVGFEIDWDDDDD